MAESEPVWLERLDAFASRFRDAFRRRDQARWAAVYLQGLLREGERKTIGGLARRVVLPPDLTVEDAAQALQNFVNQSPWDEGKLWRRHRDLLLGRFADPDSAFVLDDLAFIKQGRHSVGVQRQYSSALGRKANCQIAVGVYHAGAAGCCPLTLRLYLPRVWLQNLPRLEAAGVPEQHRRPRGKSAVALDLLDEVRAEGWPGRLVLGGAGYGADRTFREALAARGLFFLLDAPAGLEPAEGERLWPADDDPGRVRIGNFTPDGAATVLARARRARLAGRETGTALMKDLGLDHFEGRSWRGFHHHACLVMLAYGFRLLEDGPAPAGLSSTLG